MSFIDIKTLLSTTRQVLTTFGLFVLTVIGANLFKKQLSRFHAVPYPPGPKSKLFVGNTYDLPITKPWVTYANWAKQYGMVYYV